jgi:hypothetical protein
MVVAIKSNGSILREHKDTVYIPYNSEYSIYIKNLNTIRVLVHVFIDGKDVCPGGLVINANSNLDLERSITDNNLNTGNKFKFVEMTENIEKNRGIGIEDGIIRVEYQFEDTYQYNTIDNKQINIFNTILNKNSVYYSTPCTGNPPLSNIYATSNIAYSAQSANISDINSFNESGITVSGSKSEQRFTYVSSFPLRPEKNNIILKLLGKMPTDLEVKQPITVKHKPKCITCGKQNKQLSKFCVECGTSLVLYS